MRLNLYASLSHYADHLWPIWQQLPSEVRGEAWAPRHDDWWGNPQHPQAPPGPVLVASWGDACSAITRGRDLVYVEHGAGQTYEGDPAGRGAAGWAGATARGLERVRLFVCPNERVAQRWRAVHRAPAVAVGCPKMDRWHGAKRETRNAVPATVAVTFHWDCTLVAESRTAWPWYDQALPRLRDWSRAHGVHLLGHGHPRMWSRLRRRWEALGIEPVAELSDVLDRADVLVADNTSAMFEFASLDRPVVVLNAPWYRREIEHGLRFWSHVPGHQVNDPAGLEPTVAEAVRHPERANDLRAAATAAAYAACDGHAAERAARAILETL